MDAIILIIILVVIFIVVTALNIKTKVPEGIDLPEKCNGCKMTDCKHHQDVLTKEIIEEIKKDIKCKENSDER